MNHLDIKCHQQTNKDGGTYYDVDFYVDGRSFVELVKEFELPFADKLAGKYTNRYFGDYTADFLLGLKPDCGENSDKTELLVCECGCTGCWPLATRIQIVQNTLTWSDFEQPHRTWDYSGFGPFVFDLEQYRTAIAQISQIKASSPQA